jgi:aryl-alcohol dehydrogenase-like predicted oxidoreductase
LIQIHSCSEPILRAGDVIEVLERAREAGKARYIGYSGDGAALDWAIASGRFDAVQLSVNVADQWPLAVIPRALERGLGIIAKRPVANALWQHAAMPEDVTKHVYWKRLRELDYDFFRSNTAVATALQFTLSTGVHTAIVGTTRPEHLRANVQTLTGRMPADEYMAIRSRWERVATEEWVPQM